MSQTSLIVMQGPYPKQEHDVKEDTMCGTSVHECRKIIIFGAFGHLRIAIGSVLRTDCAQTNVVNALRLRARITSSLNWSGSG